MLHPTGRRGHFIGPNGVRYKGGMQSIHKRRGRYVVRRRRKSGVMHMSAAAAVAGARR